MRLGAARCPQLDATEHLADVSTRLKKLDRETQERLINWGFAICDTAMRRWVDQSLPPPADSPYPAVGVG